MTCCHLLDDLNNLIIIFALNLIISCQSDKIVNFTYNRWLTVGFAFLFLWYRIYKCDTNDRLDAVCEEIRKERNISIDVTHGWVSIGNLMVLVALIKLIFMYFDVFLF